MTNLKWWKEEFSELQLNWIFDRWNLKGIFLYESSYGNYGVCLFWEEPLLAYPFFGSAIQFSVEIVFLLVKVKDLLIWQVDEKDRLLTWFKRVICCCNSNIEASPALRLLWN